MDKPAAWTPPWWEQFFAVCLGLVWGFAGITVVDRWPRLMSYVSLSAVVVLVGLSMFLGYSVAETIVRII